MKAIFQKYKMLPIAFITLLALKGFSQGFYDDQQRYYLINSGMSKVRVYENERLTSIWHIDSLTRTIAMHTLEPTVINPVAPKYDDKFSTSSLKTYYFNKFGTIDSIFIVDHHINVSQSYPTIVDTVADTSFTIYTYPRLENWAMNRKKYSIKKGQKELLYTDYFGYDSQKKLILFIQDEGRVQFFYAYNDKGQIEKETVLGATILYKYNDSGQMVSRVTDSQQIKYEYNQKQFLVRKIVTGNNAKTTTYEYE